MPHSSAKVQPIRGQRQQADPQSPSQEKKTPEQKPATSVHPVETEDKRGAAVSQPQQRKVLQMNVGKGGNAQQHPQTPAGQHATGSFTAGTGQKNGKP